MKKDTAELCVQSIKTKSCSSGFTIAELIVCLLVLGIIACLTLPIVIRKQIEAKNRIKIKKSMQVFDFMMNRMVVENNLKSNQAVDAFADINCRNTSAYFKINKFIPMEGKEDIKCVFETPDGTAWDISSIRNPLVAPSEDDLLNGNNTFQLSSWFDDKGSLRVNDLAAATNTKDELIRVYSYINNKKVEKKPICYEVSAVYCSVFASGCEKYTYNKNGDLMITYTGCDKFGNNCTGLDKYDYDKKGNVTSRFYDCDLDGNNCKSSAKHEYDINGNETSYSAGCDGDGNGCTVMEKYEYENGLPTVSYFGCDSTGKCNSSQKYEYDGTEEPVAFYYYCDGNGSSCEYSEKYEYEDGHRVAAYGVCDGNGDNCKVSEKYKYDERGYQTAVFQYCDGNGDDCWYSQLYEYNERGQQTALYGDCDGSGNKDTCYSLTSYEYDENGNPSRIYTACDVDGTNCIMSYKYEYDKRGNEIVSYGGCNGQGEACQNTTERAFVCE